MRRKFDLRTAGGLLACAFHLLEVYGTSKRREDNRRPRLARKLACALYTVACLIETVDRDGRKAFWRVALKLSEPFDPTPLEWRQAAEALSHQCSEVINGIREDSNVEHTKLLYRSALAAIELAAAQKNEALDLLGFVLIEIAEARVLHYGNRTREQRQFIEVRRVISEERKCAMIRGTHAIFTNMIGIRSVGEGQRNNGDQAYWRAWKGTSRGTRVLPGEKSPSKLLEPSPDSRVNKYT